MFEVLSFVVHVRPIHPHHFHEKQLDQPVTSQHERGEFLAGAREPHAYVRFVMREPGIRERLHHRRSRAGDDADRACELPHGHQPVGVGQRHLGLKNGFQIVLDCLRRDHS